MEGRANRSGSEAPPYYDARVRLALALLMLVAAALSGCASLPGQRDVDLEFRSDAAPAGDEALRQSIAQRLAAARVAAAVTVAGATVRVVVTDEAATTVRELLRWRGGVAFHREAKDTVGAPRSPDAVNAAVRDAAPGALALFYDPLGVDLARTRGAERAPLATTLGTPLLAEVTSDGRGIRLRVSAEVHAAIAKGSAPRGDGEVSTPVIVIRDDTVLGTAVLAGDDTVTVAVGDGLYAYTRADRLRAMLQSPELPPLTFVATKPLSPDFGMAALGLLLPLVLSCAWLAFVRRFDRLHPEPVWLVAVVFGLGALSVVPAAAIEIFWAKLSLATNPTFATMGGRLAAFPYALLIFTLVVGLTEEGVKLAAAAFVVRRREFDEPIDGIVYGVAAALGFAAVENVKYFALGRLAPSLVLARTFTSIPAHFFLAALWGYALGQTLLPGRSRGLVFRYFALAAILHGAFDALLSTRGLAPVALLLNLGLASAFVVLVRRALRRAAVGEEAPPLSRERSTILATGSPRAFRASAVAVHVAALLLVVLGVSAERPGAAPGVAFYGAALLALSLLVVSAWGLSATLPLDVVLDGTGITFAGSRRTWPSIAGATRSRAGPFHFFAIASSEGELRVGPLTLARAAELEERFRRVVPA